jgi:hypothetical protein
MYSSTHSLTSALDGGEWSASRPGRFTPRERAPGILRNLQTVFFLQLIRFKIVVNPETNFARCQLMQLQVSVAFAVIKITQTGFDKGNVPKHKIL